MPADKNLDESLRHRKDLNKLLAVNPNYFGNLKDTPVSYTHLTLPTNREV